MKDMDSKELCDLYDKFVDDVKSDVEAYDHYMHGESREHVEVPSDRDRALGSAKMLNTAMANRLRDGMGKPVKAHDSGAVRVAPAAALGVLLVAGSRRESLRGARAARGAGVCYR